jgi:hypothetical protein
MFRFLFRATGLLFLAAAFAALVVDATRSIAGGMLMVTPLSEAFATKLGALQISLERIHPALWNPVGLWALRLPIWFVLLIGALILLRLARPPAPTVGYSSRP